MNTGLLALSFLRSRKRLDLRHAWRRKLPTLRHLSTFRHSDLIVVLLSYALNRRWTTQYHSPKCLTTGLPVIRQRNCATMVTLLSEQGPSPASPVKVHRCHAAATRVQARVRDDGVGTTTCFSSRTLTMVAVQDCLMVIAVIGIYTRTAPVRGHCNHYDQLTLLDGTSLLPREPRRPCTCRALCQREATQSIDTTGNGSFPFCFPHMLIKQRRSFLTVQLPQETSELRLRSS